MPAKARIWLLHAAMAAEGCILCSLGRKRDLGSPTGVIIAGTLYMPSIGRRPEYIKLKSSQSVYASVIRRWKLHTVSDDGILYVLAASIF